MPDQIHLVLLETDNDTEILNAFFKHANALAWMTDHADASPLHWERLTSNSFRHLLNDNHQETLWIHSYYIDDAHD
ncbi:hypothetical protein [Limnobacter sp.]|uniref:hypothetical protein n=1 Tax=Limnobacter sp. TaxID=2003368 RepID=UPI0025BBA15A|nr:hypothetical protein [Limnobacter sp.]